MKTLLDFFFSFDIFLCMLYFRIDNRKCRMKFATNLRVVEAVQTEPWVPSWDQGSREPLEPTKSVHYTDPLSYALTSLSNCSFFAPEKCNFFQTIYF